MYYLYFTTSDKLNKYINYKLLQLFNLLKNNTIMGSVLRMGGRLRVIPPRIDLKIHQL